MNPKITDILARTIAAAEQTLDRSSGDARRLDVIERLFEEVTAAARRPCEHGENPINDWTAMLLTMLRKIERAGPYGDAQELTRAVTIGAVLLPCVQRDLALALTTIAQARAATTDQDYIPAKARS